MPTYLLGIDNGCTVAKAALFGLDGREVAVASRKVPTSTPQPGWHEVDMDQAWQATVDSIREVLAHAAVRPADIACIAPTGHGNGLYLVDSAGRPVRPGILSTDSRARGYVDRWQAEGIDRRVRPMTMQDLWPGQPNALLAWLRDHEPEALHRARWALMRKDYIRLRLTGEPRAELTDMSGTSLVNVGTASYDPAVTEAFGLAEMQRLLPPLAASAEICGRVTAAAAAETGLAEGTPVAAGAFDIDACGLASGLVDESQLSLVAGTWGINQYISTRPVAQGVFMTSCYAIPGHYLMLEGSPTSASNLEWFVTEFFAAEREEAERRGQSVWDLCNELVAATTPGESAIAFLPFVWGSNVNPRAQGTLVGLQGWHRRGHVLRAIYEGVVFSHRHHVERLMQFRPAPERVRLTGGGARSPVWRAIFADGLGLPVEVPAGTELGALGAAIVAAVAAGCYADFPAAVDRMVRLAGVQMPCPDHKSLYDEKYWRYQQLIAILDQAW